jgi:hypothetical protein
MQYTAKFKCGALENIKPVDLWMNDKEESSESENDTAESDMEDEEMKGNQYH